MIWSRPWPRPVVICVLSLLVLGSAASRAQTQDERAVRAAYVFNLAKFIEWPPDKNELVLGFYGSAETGDYLRKMLDGKTAESRLVHILLFPNDSEVPKCDMVYIAESQKKKIRAVLDRVAGKNIVTVGEADWFAQEGGMVALVNNEDHIRLEVNLEALQRAGVKAGPRLLSVATIVRPAAGALSESSERKVVQREEPQYPAIAANMSLHGTVRLKVRIAPEGTVRDAECVGGHPLLADSALKAVKNWRFEVAAKESVQIVNVNF